MKPLPPDCCVRALRPAHEAALREFFSSHTPETVFQRYHHCVAAMTHRRALQLLDVDQQRDLALAVFEIRDGERIHAIARYYTEPSGQIAEMAFVVRESMRRLGLATQLLHALIAQAQPHGLRWLRAQVLTDNHPMRALLQRYASQIHAIPFADVVEYLLPVPEFPVERPPCTPAAAFTAQDISRAMNRNRRGAAAAQLPYACRQPLRTTMAKPVAFNNTVLRDGHQSLAATRMTTAQMLPAAPLLDSLGFGGLETWGGATIDSCLRFLGENPFDRLRALKKAAPKTPQLMLLRGQNIVQYTSFPDDVVEAFVKATADAGCDVLRIFDALNDTRNLATAIRATQAAGKHARGEICYTTSPVHTLDAFARLGKELETMGCDSIGLKDMSGVISPKVAFDLVTTLKRTTGLPVTLHTHDTAGLGAAACVAAVEAGVDAIETSIAPFANGTAQPDTVRMLALLEGHPRCPRYDTATLFKLRQHFTEVYRELSQFTSTDNERVDSDTLCYQVPGGMLSNFRSQLREQKMMDKFDEVMAEVPVVRAALGWIPLVTPTSQIVGTQAMMNVKFGRWKNLAQATNDIALGKYGRTPGPVDPGLLELVVKKTGQKPVEGRLADSLAPRMDSLRAELVKAGLPSNNEACVLHAMFPREFAALHQPPGPKPATPVVVTSATPAAAPVRATGPGRPLALTINGRRVVANVEEIA